MKNSNIHKTQLKTGPAIVAGMLALGLTAAAWGVFIAIDALAEKSWIPLWLQSASILFLFFFPVPLLLVLCRRISFSFSKLSGTVFVLVLAAVNKIIFSATVTQISQGTFFVPQNTSPFSQSGILSASYPPGCEYVMMGASLCLIWGAEFILCEIVIHLYRRIIGRRASS